MEGRRQRGEGGRSGEERGEGFREGRSGEERGEGPEGGKAGSEGERNPREGGNGSREWKKEEHCLVIKYRVCLDKAVWKISMLMFHISHGRQMFPQNLFRRDTSALQLL